MEIESRWKIIILGSSKLCYYFEYYPSDTINPCGASFVVDGVCYCSRTPERKKELASWGCLYKCNYEIPKLK